MLIISLDFAAVWDVTNFLKMYGSLLLISYKTAIPLKTFPNSFVIPWNEDRLVWWLHKVSWGRIVCVFQGEWKMKEKKETGHWATRNSAPFQRSWILRWPLHYSNFFLLYQFSELVVETQYLVSRKFSVQNSSIKPYYSIFCSPDLASSFRIKVTSR